MSSCQVLNMLTALASEDVHHVPGRLRVKLPAIKSDPARAGAALRSVESLLGVRRVQVNEITGSLLVSYDAHQARPSDILRHLRASGFSLSEGVNPSSARSVSSDRGVSVSAVIARTAANVLLEIAVDRSTRAILALV
jgi:Heavy metal associated domain 2